jgi:hypothetical protein
MLLGLITFIEPKNRSLDPKATNTTKTQIKIEPKALYYFTNFIFMLVLLGLWPFNYLNCSNSKYNPPYSQALQKSIKNVKFELISQNFHV